MQFRNIIIMGVTLTLLSFGLGTSAKEQVKEASQLRSLDWLAGTWEGPATWIRGGVSGPGEGRFLATYSSSQGGEILSLNKFFDAAGRVTFFEFERIAVTSGRVALTPFPGGRQASPFGLETLDEEKRVAVFSNPSNDWPTRISYAREGDTLSIQASGLQGKAEVLLRLQLRRR